MRQRRRSSGRARSAAALIEFALLLPLLVTLILGTWEVGRMIQIYQVVANAAREGARQAASAKYTNDEVRQAVFEYLQRNGLALHDTLPPGSVDLTNTNCTITVAVANGSNQAFDADQGVPMTVTVGVPVKNFQWVLGNTFVPANAKAESSVGFLCLKDYPIIVDPVIPQSPLP